MPKPTVPSPGSVLSSLMDEYQLIPAKLAEAIKLSPSAVRQVAIGKTRISVPVALRFAKYFGFAPEYWLDLQNKYDLSEAAKDSELTAVLKGISKAKKPAPQKASKPVPVAKNAAKKTSPKRKPTSPKTSD